MIQIKQKNNVIIITLIVVSVITGLVFACIETPKAAIQRKMKGFWNIEFENSGWDRYQEYDISTIFHIQSKDTIELPFVYGEDKPFLQSEAEATGTWKVISINPDSVFFNVPKNPLYGNYAVQFLVVFYKVCYSNYTYPKLI